MTHLEYLKIPFKHQGNDVNGADCLGFIRIFYANELGIQLPEFTEDYPLEWWKEKNYILDLYEEWNFERTNEFKRGNVILFRNSNTTPGHIGVVLDNENFIHMSRTGVSVHTYTFGVWARQIHSVYRFKG